MKMVFALFNSNLGQGMIRQSQFVETYNQDERLGLALRSRLKKTVSSSGLFDLHSSHIPLSSSVPNEVRASRINCSQQRTPRPHVVKVSSIGLAAPFPLGFSASRTCPSAPLPPFPSSIFFTRPGFNPPASQRLRSLPFDFVFVPLFSSSPSTTNLDTLILFLQRSPQISQNAYLLCECYLYIHGDDNN